MKSNSPPPVINLARLLAYAVTDDEVKFTNKIKLFVDGERLGKVPKLAICESLDADKQILLFFCDENWEALGTIAVPSVEDAKRKAEVGYEGILAKWNDSKTSVQDAEKYLKASGGMGIESAFAKGQCTYCKKLSGEVERLYGTEEALICDECIEEFYKYLQQDRGEK